MAYATMREAGIISATGIDRDKRTITDATGRFEFMPIFNAKTVLVTHESGCAKVRLEKLIASSASASGTLAKRSTEPIHLNAWGRVEGTLWLGRNPGVNQSVMIYNGSLTQPADSPNVPFSYETRTDAQGRFAFEFVTQGTQVVCRVINPHEGKPGPIGLSHKVKVSVPQNDVARLDIGGRGRVVTGRLVTDSASRKIDWGLDVNYLEAADQEMVPMVPLANADLLSEWMAANELRQLRYYFSCREDGSFRVDDVPSGTYRLVATVSEIRDDNPRRLMVDSRPIGWLKREVIVPESDRETDDGAIELGEMHLELNPGVPQK